MTPLVVALAGTDHHPFDRLVHWVDDAATRHPDLRFFVQYGTAAPPTVAEGRAYLEHDVMIDLMEHALLIVCHGGPGTIMDAAKPGTCHWSCPVTRRSASTSTVTSSASRGSSPTLEIATLIGSVESLRHEVDQAVTSGPRRRASAAVATARDEARALLATELDSLINIPRPRRGSSPQVRGRHRSLSGRATRTSGVRRCGYTPIHGMRATSRAGQAPPGATIPSVSATCGCSALTTPRTRWRVM